MILQFVIATICSHYLNSSSKLKLLAHQQRKIEQNNEQKKVGIKFCTGYYMDGITKIENFEFNDILLHEKSYENIFIYKVS